MTLRRRWLSEASDELAEEALRQEERSSGGARRFRLDVYETIDLIERFPRSGPRVRNVPNAGERELRRKRVQGYDRRYWVVYHLDQDTLWIMAVTHSSRSPDHWHDRV